MNKRERIEQAFLQLQYAEKLYAYTAEGHIDKSLFDCGREVCDEWGQQTYKPNAFERYEDLVIASWNTFMLSFGAAINALDVALEEAGLPRCPDDHTPKGS